ncbi:MAG: HK97 family phage prohead protease [Ignavibacteria bacterium]|nr:HK97 family phage prohead protease [Ignavibacteria bacterium]
MEPLQNTKYKEFTQVDAEVNDNDRTIVHYISTIDKDRTNEVISPAVINDTNYKKNPVVLFSHNYDFVIGKSLWGKVDNTGYGYLSKTQFAKTPLGDEIFHLYKDGFLNAWSIGYRELEPGNYLEDGTYTYNSIELLEYSAVSVPANPSALNLSFVKGLKSNELKNHFLSEYIISDLETQIKNLQSEITTLKQDDVNEILANYKSDFDNRISEIAGEIEFMKSIQVDHLKDFVRNTVAGAVRNALKV